jgi:adenylate cyclase class 2
MLEIEVKFYVPDLAKVRLRVVAAGATLKNERVYERNIRYDNAWDGLIARGAMLRLRQDKRAKMTFKGIPLNTDIREAQARVREEIEFEVGDFDSADLLLQRIGFEPRQIYEKYRETFQLGDVEIVLDEMPYGDFVELEGSEAELRRVTDQLGLSWDARIITNYLGLLAELNAKHRLAIQDLTFENFKGQGISIADILG